VIVLAEVGCVADVIDAEESTDLIVAYASEDGDMVEQHFGSALGFYVYKINGDSAELIATKSFGKELKDGNEDKLKPKLAWLVGSDLVYCASIGGSATKQLIALGITPIVIKGGPDVDDLISELQQELNDGPSAMIKRILQQKAPRAENRFDDMDDEGWGG
jgi:nitrogen fixation protein NifX|tara:strand:- start:3785 stop:4267 length:483 start_codon:yes stop_codon:yes gene_type:complete